MLDLESDFTLWAFSFSRLERDSVGPGASSVSSGGQSTGGGVAEVESGAFPLFNTTSSTGGGARADKVIYWNFLGKYCVSFRK